MFLLASQLHHSLYVCGCCSLLADPLSVQPSSPTPKESERSRSTSSPPYLFQQAHSGKNKFTGSIENKLCTISHTLTNFHTLRLNLKLSGAILNPSAYISELDPPKQIMVVYISANYGDCTIIQRQICTLIRKTSTFMVTLKAAASWASFIFNTGWQANILFQWPPILCHINFV